MTNNEYVPYLATCRTSKCFNENITLEVIVKLPDPVVVCGVCGEQITEISPV